MTNSVSDRLRELAKQADPALADPRYTNKKRTEDAALLRAVADFVKWHSRSHTHDCQCDGCEYLSDAHRSSQ